MLIAIGFIVLGSYGVIVNLIGLDFSRLLGAYVGWFAVISMLFGRFLFGDRLTLTTCLGLALVLSGSLVILSGSRSSAAGALTPGVTARVAKCRHDKNSQVTE